MAATRLVLLGPVPPPFGGVQTHMMALRERALARGMQVHVLNITRHRSASLPDVHHPRTPLEVLRHARALRPDVVHMHAGGVLSSRLVALLGLLTASSGAPVHFTFHSGGFPTSPEGQALTRAGMTAFVLRRLQRVIGVNAELTSMFERLGVRHERVALIRPDFPVHVDPLAAPGALVEFAKRSLPFLFSVGGMEPVYQVDKQIEAMPAIVERWPKAGLLIVGSGIELAQRQAEAASSPLSNQLLVPGDVSHAGVLALMSLADTVLRPTCFDGDAISVREALQLGRPVVATRTAFRPDGVTLIPSADPEHLVAGIAAALAAGSPPSVRPDDWTAIDAVIDGYQ